MYNMECGYFVVKVLSKEEHVSWWAVRALKTDSVGFVPANFLNHAAEKATLGTDSQVSFRLISTNPSHAAQNRVTI
jgi:hypothetical protein